MKVLGIDPGIERCGWAVIEEQNSKVVALSYDCIFTSKTQGIATRLEELYDQIFLLVKKYQPDALSLEDLFFNSNAKTAIVVGQARGVIILAAAKCNLDLFSYTPLQVKMAITGYGRAEKEQIQMMVKNILHLPKIPTPDDTADALAVALAHMFMAKFKSRIKSL